MRLLFWRKVNGQDQIQDAPTSPSVSALAAAIKTLPSVGKPFLVFNTLPFKPSTVDFDLHPDWPPGSGNGNVVSADTATNIAMINAMLAEPPLDALIQ